MRAKPLLPIGEVINKNDHIDKKINDLLKTIFPEKTGLMCRHGSVGQKRDIKDSSSHRDTNSYFLVKQAF